MSIARFCDHRGVVYRATELRDELQDVTQVWEPLTAPAGLNCTMNRNWSGGLEMPGPGEQQGTYQQWFLLPGFTIRERDVLSITEGPNAPVLLKIHSVAAATRPIELHHYEVIGEVWHGSLVEPAMGS
jgi:hypothetical protein